MNTFEETKKLLDDSSFYYIIATNMEGRYTYVNTHYRKAFEPIHGPIVGEPYQKTMHPDDTKVCEEVALKCFAEPDRVFPATIRKVDGKGGYIITQWEYKALLDEKQEPAGIFCLGFDITAYTMQSKQLQEAQHIIEQKNEVLEEMVFNHSHVIRRPLANILGLAMILENMEMDQNLRNICTMIIDSSNQLDAVIRTNVNKAYPSEVNA